MEINESFGIIENFFNKTPQLEIDSSSDNTAQLIYDYNLIRNIDEYD